MLFVQNTGMFTPVGRNTGMTAGSLLTHTPYFSPPPENPHPALICAQTGLPSQGLERLVDMAGFALSECSRGVEGQSVPLLLCTSDPAFLPQVDPSTLYTQIADRAPNVLAPRLCKVFPGSSTTLLSALAMAETLLTQTQYPFCYVGAVDSLVTTEALGWLEQSGRLRSDGSPQSFLPGEGAAILRVANVPSEHDFAVIEGFSQGEENHPLPTKRPSTGRGLAAALHATLHAAQAAPGQVRLLAHACQGEDYFAEEMALAAATMGLNGDTHQWSLGYCLGELGAATGAILLAYLGFLFREHALVSSTDRPLSPGEGALLALSTANTQRAGIFLRGRQ